MKRDTAVLPPVALATTSARLTRVRCPFCHDALAVPSEALWACPRCATPHHDSCARENGACTVLGCGEVTTTDGASRPLFREEEVILPRVRYIRASERLGTQAVAALHLVVLAGLGLLAQQAALAIQKPDGLPLFIAAVTFPVLLAPFVLRAAVLDVIWPARDSRLVDLWWLIFETLRGQRR